MSPPVVKNDPLFFVAACRCLWENASTFDKRAPEVLCAASGPVASLTLFSLFLQQLDRPLLKSSSPVPAPAVPGGLACKALVRSIHAAAKFNRDADKKVS